MIWPTTLHNATQLELVSGTVNYCRMYMGPEFADLARPFVELTKKGVDFIWTDEHTAPAKKLKRNLTNYTTLQVSDPEKPYVLRTEVSPKSGRLPK